MRSLERKVNHRILKILSIALVTLTVLTAFTIALHSILEKSPLGADFYTFWLAAQSNFLEGKNPYSEDVTLLSQIGIYGKPATPDQDQVAFAYPVYSLFILLPIAWMDYAWAESAWMVINILLLVSAIYLSFPKAPRWLGISFLVFYPVTFGLILGNFAVTIAAILILFYGFFVQRDHPSSFLQILMGLLVAWITAKPQFTWFFLIFILLISLRKKYNHFLISLILSGLVFFSVSFVLVPGWFLQWLGRIQEYAGYVQSQPTITNFLAVFKSPQIMNAGTWIFGLICAGISIWLLLLWIKKKLIDIKLFAWIGFVTYLFHPHGISYEQLCFLVPLLCWMGITKDTRWRHVISFWFLPLILSWLVFVISKWYIPSADEWPLFFYGIFLAWLFFFQDRQQITMEKSPHGGERI